MANLKDTNVNGDLSVDGKIHIQKDIMSGGGGLLNHSLGWKVFSGHITSNQSARFQPDVVTDMNTNSYLIIGTHFEHGECGACYLFWTGRASGGKLVEITSSPHLKLTLSNNNNVIDFTGDSWGCGINIYKLNLGGWIDNEIK